MKKRIGLCAIAAFIAAGQIGCTSVTNKDCIQVPAEATIVPVKFKPKVEVINNGGVEGSATGAKVFWVLTSDYPTKFAKDSSAKLWNFGDPLKDAAVYNACENANADILLAPRFTEEYDSVFFGFSKTRTVTVKGIPAKIVGAEEVEVISETAELAEILKSLK